ncbi:peptidoglycan editing factor PgeF [Aureimonas altamirensis]|uniref:peptidoglycan editing factor PgeF n=1 Tax=Aureimonas altamirensis TaxID=370622 RepID=UPI001E3D7B53|nr:peptidoglycan editing factor PgeF [Aureimonas altamirensis]UHD46934.1 peptidoglycan editing factor PgeF [Aureimonas altamirensis]
MNEASLEADPTLTQDDVVSGAPLDALAHVRHAFFTRRGGVSRGIYEGLNVGIGSDDEPAHVAANRRAAMRWLGASGEGPATPWQVHSPDVAVIDAPFVGTRPKADGVVTAKPGLAIGVVTADCGPVLFADRQGRAVGAAHAGWRGALGGVLESTIAAMEGLGAARGDIVAVLGPCITAPNYEVGAAMMAEFVEADPAFARFFAPGVSPEKRQFDLPGFILATLERAGVEGHFVGRCTYGEPAAFYSFRRTTHRGEPDYGRQLSAIMLNDSF